ncbi:hypothetical protein B566_EDAN001673 [Ephemera danica]|nr:hypothetical protein B566_EDAN001673 [Ephemera danica]
MTQFKLAEDIMELVLGEMAAMMDMHHRASQFQQVPAEPCPVPPSQGPTRPPKAPTWAISLSPAGSSGSSDDAAEIFPWSHELRQALRYRLQNHHYSEEELLAPAEAAVQYPGPQVPSRKRKIWDELESLEVKSLPGQLEGTTTMQPLQDSVRPLSASHGAALHHTGEIIRPPPTPRSAARARAARRDLEQGATGRMSSWHDIDDNLAADLDGSLSGLGEDLSTASYNMSEALLALPSLTVFKQEAPSPTSHNDTSAVQQTSPNTDMEGRGRDGSPTTLHHLLHHVHHGAHHHSGGEQHSGYHSPPGEARGGGQLPGDDHGNGCGSNNGHHINGDGSGTHDAGGLDRYHRLDKLNETAGNEDYRFQYVLAAATSIATKINEETLTYLNQGQSYEIKLKKLGDLSAYRGKILKSVIRICFHERRLQFMEREKLAAWRLSRPGDRIVEVDIPLSYGVWDVVQDQAHLNAIEFLWDPTKEVGVYIKKHGGEKGVPFRIQVETYSTGEGNARRLHAAVCQIKVFKLKGADRKHKQDREKILKRPLPEQEKYQPSYDCTVLTDIPADTTVIFPVNTSTTCLNGSSSVYTPTENQRGGGTPTSFTKEENSPCGGGGPSGALPSQGAQQPGPSSADFLDDIPAYMEPLPSEATVSQTAQWLQTQRFNHFMHTFSSFCGADILRLSRDDLIRICGLADGIRLFNALHSKAIAPRLTLYLCLEGRPVFHALYLTSLQCSEMINQLAHLVGVAPHAVADVYLQGPAGIHVLLTDQVVCNLKDESMFSVEILQDASGEQYRLLLKGTSP